MRKVTNLAGLVAIFMVFLVNGGVAAAFGATYYVRQDGGTATQCNGLANAPYPGSGTNQNCAWNHPFWALDENGNWRLRSGDTLIIGRGSYRMGMGEPNTGWCGDISQYNELAFACVLPPLPSGTPGNPTRILGEGWDSGCQNPPELWGHGGIRQIISLEGTSNVEIQCLELTDHSSCGGFYSGEGQRLSMYCDYPVGNYAQNGIYATDSSYVLLRNLNIHGFGDSGIVSARLSNWRLENVRLAGNGMSGWNGDTGEENVSNSGDMILRRVTVEWNGCPESYPSKEPANCFAQTFGGYGDGIGMGRTGGNWIIEDSVFRYNVSDGLDLLYAGVGHPATVRVERTMAYGNAGNQLKVGGSSTFINNVAVGNCDYFYGKPFAPYFSPEFGVDHCRAWGGAVVISLSRGNTSYVINNTVAGHGWALFEVQCATRDFPDQPACTGSEQVYIQNNIIIGAQDVVVAHLRPGEHNLADLLGDGVASDIPCQRTTDVVHFDWNVIYNAQTSFDDLNLTGPHDIIADPMVVNSDFNNFDGHLRAGSPAIDSGLPVGSLNGLVPSSDILGITRPQGSGVDRGAYEYISGISTYRLTITISGTGSGTVTSTPTGINCGSICSAQFSPGTIVTLTATAFSNSTFAGWGGDPDCSDGQVTMNADKTCIAIFETSGGGEQRIGELVNWYYNRILGREPDQGGLNYWVSEINRIISLGICINEGFVVLGKNFFNSAEYLSNNKNNEDYVTDLYWTFLHRAPDSGGLSYWVGQLVQGLPRNIILYEFIFSQEFQDYMGSLFGYCSVRPEYVLLTDLYRGLLWRLPDDNGFRFWLGNIQEAQCKADAEGIRAIVRQIALGFIHSTEYTQRGVNNSGFLVDLYDAILRRGGDYPGYVYWLDLLNRGVLTREQVLEEFIKSPEFQGRVNRVISAGCGR